MKTVLLEWHPDVRSLIADSSRGRYRIVYSNGYHCLRLEELGNRDYKWMGQFSTPAQAKAVAQENEEQLRRLKAWVRYMRNNDPPTDAAWDIDD